VSGATNLESYAPGIAEALIATAAGLFAAIPAAVAYNSFLRRVRVMIIEMDEFQYDFIHLPPETAAAGGLSDGLPASTAGPDRRFRKSM